MNAQEDAKYWHAAEFDNLELLRANFITHSFDRHIHEGYAIGVILRGAETFYYRGGNHIAAAGQAVVINPAEIHTGTAVTESGWAYRMLYPGIGLMRQIASEITGRRWEMPMFGDPVIEDADLALRLYHLNRVLEESPSRMARETHLRDALGAFILRYAVNRPLFSDRDDARGAVAKARAYLEAHYAEDVSLETLAAIAGLSAFHLVRLFRRAYGLPPHLYLTHVRVLRAKALLAGGQPIAEVAAAVGFTDQSHLTRRFKRIVGVTPGQYQRAI
jgi:AraC-like DNA-binding protein